ncbi:MAG TPA: glycosyl hydrolase family 65 protein [Acidimicrobiales bacterium]|nr:glycosyl hydrolase family 65 protein [Acidimicrobiales bacterium]
MNVPSRLDETFDALIFDWDGTAVPDRQADASEVRRRVESLCAAGVHIFVVSGTHVANVDGQLRARPSGPGRLQLCCNRGSEVFEVTGSGPSLVYRRAVAAEEDVALDQAAERTIKVLQARGLEATVVSSRLNRRKIDLIPIAEWADPKKADIAALYEAVKSRLAEADIGDLADVIALAADAARTAGLALPRITSDVKHVEIGLTDKSDSARFAAAWLKERGITGQLVLIAGDEFGTIGGVPGSDALMLVCDLERAPAMSVGVEPGGVPPPVAYLGGGPGRFATQLDAQLERRARHRAPQIDTDPRWVVPLPSARVKERVAESLGALSNGWAGTRASREEDGPGTTPLFAVAGVYATDGHLLAGPDWIGLSVAGGHRHQGDRRVLDLRTGVLARFGEGNRTLRSVRFVSAASPDALAFRAEGPPDRLDEGDLLRPPLQERFEHEVNDGIWVGRTSNGDSEIAVAARDLVTTGSEKRVVERLAAWAAGTTSGATAEEAQQRLARLDALGFDALLSEHRHAWAARWADAAVGIEGGPDALADELAARYSVFHLLCAASDTGDAAVGARGLTGEAYNGHVFWDADVFVLPALAAISPQAARAMLEYRIRRLPAARAIAEARGFDGARFPWESAADGSDVTPRVVQGRHGEPIPIATGTHEEHIVADVAWAADRYATWTGDTAFLAGRPGRDLVVEAARYWASRIRLDPGGRGHLYGVMGPDEYHEVVDDNAYTNVMARWNLRRGAELLAVSRRNSASTEAARWRDLAERLVDGWNPDLGIYEQFAGYFELEPLLVSQVAQPPVAIDVLLGAERVRGSQLIKQADVLMLHHLLPTEVVDGSLGACLAFYEPRTAHGSSLSPAISAALLARAGQLDRALELFRLAARLDLDDLTGTTASGLHLATMGGVWQALAYGFLGLEAQGEVLALEPHLPGAWSALSMRLRFRGQRLQVRAEHDQITIGCDRPLAVRVAARPPQNCDPPGATFDVLMPQATYGRRP